MPASRDIRILLVDDYSAMRKTIRNLLQNGGFHNILEAEDGDKALEVLRSQPVDLVISDWNMPSMPGIELLKQVRADPALARTPFLMVTAESMVENIVQAVKAGVNNYIVKPFTADVLLDKIERVFK